MNRYQIYAMKDIKIDSINTHEEGKLNSYKLSNNLLTLEQNENYNITKYKLSIYGTAISKVEYNDSCESVVAEKISEHQHLVNIDFENKISFIKIYIKNDLVDPIIVNIEYLFADVKKYDLKVEKEKEAQLIKKASVIVDSGLDLINVSFQPINEKYSYSKVELYKVCASKTNDYQLMGKYKVEGEIYFHSITGLAYGKYSVILYEYDHDDNVIYKTDYIIVDVKENSQNYNRRSRGIVGPC